MIKINNLSYKLRNNIILNDISINIQKGDFWLIFGPNGAGKTTLFKILSGLIHNYSGKVFINDRNIKKFKRKEIARSIAYLPQFEEFTLPLTVNEILKAGRYPYSSLLKGYSKKDKKIINNVLKTFDIDQFINRNIHSLSGGERKKVMLASAFIQDVDIILLDEPFTFLDPDAGNELKNLLKKMNNSGKTIVAVSHSIETLFSEVNKTLALKEGKVLYSGKKIFSTKLFKKTFNVKFNRVKLKGKEIIYKE